MKNKKETKQEAQLLSYKPAQFAMLALISGEQVLISIGSLGVKILSQRPIAGWLWPKTIASKQLSAWHPEYLKQNSFDRKISRGMALEGLIALIMNCKSVDEIRHTWPTMQNPITSIAREVFKFSPN
jgi:hypothetical protein